MMQTNAITEKCYVDVCGSFIPTVNNNKHIINIIDPFSKFAVAVAIKDCECRRIVGELRQ